jgi:hypothetical protein
MIGHLQRMVAAVARPQRAVRPLVGSLFIPPAQPAIAEESSILLAPAPLPNPAQRDLSAARESEAPQTTNQHTHLLQHTHPSRLVDSSQFNVDRSNFDPEQFTSDQFTPGTSPPSRSATQFPQEAASTQASADSPTAPNKATAKRAPFEVFEVEGTTPIAKITPLVPREEEAGPFESRRPRPHQNQPSPLIHSSTQTGEGPRAEIQAPGHAQRPRELERPARDRPTDPARRHSSEDIQIHIGRIEVIAVPTPVQRPVAVAARKTESLEEYLRRRDRRPR